MDLQFDFNRKILSNFDLQFKNVLKNNSLDYFITS